MSKKSAPIAERIRHLNLPPTCYVPIEQTALDRTLSPLNLPELVGHSLVNQVCSIAEITIEAATEKLRQVMVVDQFVLIYWPDFQEGFSMSWNTFLQHFDELYLPGSDDVIVTDLDGLPLVEITHEEEIRLFR